MQQTLANLWLKSTALKQRYWDAALIFYFFGGRVGDICYSEKWGNQKASFYYNEAAKAVIIASLFTELGKETR